MRSCGPFDEDETAREARLLVEDCDVGRSELRDFVHRLLIFESLLAYHGDRGFRIEGDQLQAGAEIFDEIVDGIPAAPADDPIEILRAEQGPFHRLVAAAPVDRAEGLHDRMIGIDIGHGAQNRHHGEWIAGRHLDDIDRLHQRALRNGRHRTAR